jgi:hypothetical protein
MAKSEVTGHHGDVCSVRRLVRPSRMRYISVHYASLCSVVDTIKIHNLNFGFNISNIGGVTHLDLLPPAEIALLPRSFGRPFFGSTRCCTYTLHTQHGWLMALISCLGRGNFAQMCEAQ